VDTSDNLIFTKRVWYLLYVLCKTITERLVNINIQYRMKGKLILMYSYSTVLVHFMYTRYRKN